MVWDVDANCIRLSYPSLLAVFAEQILSKESDIAGETKLERAATRYISFLDKQDRRKVVDCWSLLGGLLAARTFPGQFLSDLFAYHMDFGLLDSCANIPVCLWPKK